MKKARILFALGVWVAILPFLGFPGAIKTILFALTGLGLMYFGYNLYRIARREGGGERRMDSFAENGGFDQTSVSMQ